MKGNLIFIWLEIFFILFLGYCLPIAWQVVWLLPFEKVKRFSWVYDVHSGHKLFENSLNCWSENFFQHLIVMPMEVILAISQVNYNKVFNCVSHHVMFLTVNVRQVGRKNEKNFPKIDPDSFPDLRCTCKRGFVPTYLPAPILSSRAPKLILCSADPYRIDFSSPMDQNNTAKASIADAGKGDNGNGIQFYPGRKRMLK